MSSSIHRVLVFGDSIAYGGWDTEGGWVDRIKRHAHKRTVEAKGQTKTQIVNLGIGGNTSTKILQRMEAEIAARKAASWPLVFVFSFGTNDERSEANTPETSLKQFEENTRQIITLARKHTGKILFVECPPLGRPVVDFKGTEYSDERVRHYSNHQAGIVESEGIEFVKIRQTFKDKPIHLHVYDDVHLNDAGHELIARSVEPKLLELLS